MIRVVLTCCLVASSCALAQDLPLFDNHSDVGTVLHPGSVQYDPATRTYTVAGSGENMWAASDAFQFVWKKVTGDVTLTADVTFLGTGGEAHRKGVLMIRQTLDADSPYVDAALHGNGLTSIQARDEKGAITHEVQSHVSAPRRARIAKHGKFVYVSVAGEGEELYPSGGSMQLEFDGPFYLGIGVCAHNKDAVEKVAFSNVELSTATAIGQPTFYSTLEVVRLAAITDHRAVVVAKGRIESPAWTPDGLSLTYNLDGASQQVLAAGGKPESIGRSGPRQAPPSQLPQLSPDGQHLAYLSHEKDSGVTLRIFNLTTSKIDILGRSGESVDTPVWSPDSSRIAFVSYQLIPN